MPDITEKLLSQPGQVQLRELIRANPVDGWDKVWQNGVTPWDAGEAQPPLRTLLASGVLDLPKTGRAFVPGCGRGYDTLTIASELGYETFAIDISQVAVDAANKFVDSSNNPASARVSIEAKDFFSVQEQYDLVYDYTFFVALLPSRRADWGNQMATLVKPNGYLVALLFPILDQPDGVGPPFKARTEDYVEALGSGWEKVVDEVPKDSSPMHQGIERLLVWQRK